VVNGSTATKIALPPQSNVQTFQAESPPLRKEEQPPKET